MIENRLDKLLQLFEKFPDDDFIIYGIALEYTSGGRYDKALEYFNLLLKNHENYLPAYYQLGKVYELLKDENKAIEIYEKGILLAKQQNEIKTLNELRQARDELI